LIIRPTIKGSSCAAFLSAIFTQFDGNDKPVSLSLIPHNLFTSFVKALTSSSIFLIFSVYGPRPYFFKMSISSSSVPVFFNLSSF